MQLNASSTAGSTYSWTGPNGFSSANQNPIINPVSILNSGTYNVVASSAFCSSASAIINVTVNPKPFASASSNTSGICSGNTIDISGAGGGTYSWSGPNGFTSSNAIDFIANSTIAASGTYTLVVTSAANCKDTATVGIIVSQTPTTPVVTANTTDLCEGDALQLNAISTAGSTYSWSGPNGYSSAIQNPLINIVTVSNSGNYSVIASSPSCSSVAATIAITVNANPVATASSTTLAACSGNSIDLSGTGGGSYDWSGPNGFNSTNANDVITNATTSASGTYTLTITNAAGCKNTATVDIAVSQSPLPPTASNVNTCSGAPLMLTANGTGTINWYSDAALTNLVQANSATYVPTNPTSSVATYYYTATSNGCTSSTASVTASNGNVNASAFISDTIGFTPITINFINTSMGIDANDNSLWLFGDGNSANTFNASNTYTIGGNYIVTLIVTEIPTGCVDTASYHVFYDGESFIIIPNIFTPNGDGSNEGLMIKSKGIKELGGEIYDRWGLKMFEWTTVNGSWDGTTMNGKPAPDGTYFYIIKAVAFSGKEYVEKGALQLTR
jgi:gliding motility-associated-like protein